MTLRNQISHAWHRLTGVDAASAETAAAARKTTPLPAILSPYTGSRVSNSTPKPPPANLRKFAETPIARRAINLVKDKIACMDYSVRLRRGCDVPDAHARIHALRTALAEPNATDSFRTLFEQALEDLLVNGTGAIEMETTGDPAQPFLLYPVDAATIEIDPNFSGDPAQPRYAQTAGTLATRKPTPLLDQELMYIRLNPRTHTPF